MSEQTRKPAPMDEEIARWYVSKYGDHVSNAMTVQVACLNARDVVLDIGCGSGTAVRKAAAIVTDGRVIGVDPSSAMLRIAAEETASDAEGDRVEFRDGSAESLPLDDGTITVAMAISSIHHWHDLEGSLAEVLRVLAPGGRFIVSEERLANGRFGHGDGPTANPEYVAQAMRDSGFSKVEIGAHKLGHDTIQFVTGNKAEAEQPAGTSGRCALPPE